MEIISSASRLVHRSVLHVVKGTRVRLAAKLVPKCPRVIGHRRRPSLSSGSDSPTASSAEGSSSEGSVESAAHPTDAKPEAETARQRAFAGIPRVRSVSGFAFVMVAVYTGPP